MTSIPEDFWNALKSGNTSDGLFWAAIAIIIGVLFLLLSIARCIMWCCGTTNKAESVGSEAQNLQPDRRPVDWPNNFQEPQPPTRQNVRHQTTRTALSITRVSNFVFARLNACSISTWSCSHFLMVHHALQNTAVAAEVGTRRPRNSRFLGLCSAWCI